MPRLKRRHGGNRGSEGYCLVSRAHGRSKPDASGRGRLRFPHDCTRRARRTTPSIQCRPRSASHVLPTGWMSPGGPTTRGPRCGEMAPGERHGDVRSPPRGPASGPSFSLRQDVSNWASSSRCETRLGSWSCRCLAAWVVGWGLPCPPRSSPRRTPCGKRPRFPFGEATAPAPARDPHSDASGLLSRPISQLGELLHLPWTPGPSAGPTGLASGCDTLPAPCPRSFGGSRGAQTRE